MEESLEKIISKLPNPRFYQEDYYYANLVKRETTKFHKDDSPATVEVETLKFERFRGYVGHYYVYG